MTAWRIEEAKEEHLAPIVRSMRTADKKEVWASHRYTPAQALNISFVSSVKVWTCLVNGTPAFMWGVSRKGSIFSETGIPWLLGTDTIHSVSREFVKQSKAYIQKMHEPFRHLENYVHAENTASIKWLTWCGFTLDDEATLINNEKFYHFWRISSCVQ